MQRSYGWWVAAAVWMAVIFYFSAQGGAESAGLSDAVARWIESVIGRSGDGSGLRLIVRKAAHAGEYAVLGALLVGALGAGRGRLRVGAGAWLIAVGYAATDELHQLLVPGRSGQVTDVLIDGAGAAVGVIVAVIVMMHRGDKAR